MIGRNGRRALVAVVGSGAALFACPARASDLIVEVSGIRSNAGEVGCALFSAPAGFPLDPGRAAQQHWQPAAAATAICRFTGLKPGHYAVAVTHDLNGNHRTDTNFLGLPTEDWGVSKNPRPTLRAPRFEEAAFAVTDAPATKIAIDLAP